jgi:peptidoglycan/LPS O-acetylase OafA/YrhL
MENFMAMQNKRLIGIVFTVGILLLIPFIAMRFTNDVNWDLTDFTVAGVLLLGTGLLCELVMRKVSNLKYRIALCAAILMGLFCIWVEIATDVLGRLLTGN